MSAATLKSQPDSPVYLDTYAWILYKMGRYQDAFEYIKKAIASSDQPDPDILEHYGDILYQLGYENKALEIWKKAKKISDGKTDVLDQKIREKKLID